MALAFPDGVRPRRLDRALLVAVYGFAVVHGLLNAMFAPAFQGRSSVLQVGAGSETIIGQAGLLYLVPVAAEVIIIVLVVSRWIRATSVTRPRNRRGRAGRSADPGLYVDQRVSRHQRDCLGGRADDHPGGARRRCGVVTITASRRRRPGGGPRYDAAADLETLRTVLARALRDPGLVLLRSGRRTTDPLDLAEARRQWPHQQVLPLVRRGRTVGALVHDPSVRDERRRLDAVAAAAALVLDNGLLVEDLADQLAEVSTSRARIVTAGDAQRRRLEQDLHDGAQQRLVSAALLLQMANAELEIGSAGPPDEEDAKTFVVEAQTELSGALSELREHAHGLAPATLTEYGLGPALEALIDRFPAAGLLVCCLTQRLDPAIETAAYYLVAEAVTKAVKHADATAISVNVSLESSEVVIRVSDDGVGGAKPDGFGVLSMSDRAAALGGQVSLTSEPSLGTQIIATVPAGTR
jgi:signal transduction histidine kinase